MVGEQWLCCLRNIWERHHCVVAWGRCEEDDNIVQVRCDEDDNIVQGRCEEDDYIVQGR